MENLYHQRKLLRANFINYSHGQYFITICTHGKEHFFGEIYNGEIHFSPIGAYCDRQFKEIPNHYSYGESLIHQIMPNHVHSIISVVPPDPYDEGRIRSLLSVIVGGIKRSVTLYARQNDIIFGWQRGYHDHLIRNGQDGQRIWDYIETNVARWGSDRYY